MPSSIAWLDHSEADQQRVRELLQLFTDKETVDDLGLGTIRDAISNQFFPGTSTIQTRARYFVFLPWIFGRAERSHPQNLVAKAQDMERKLIQSLLSGGETSGVIGREAGRNLKTLPSAVYWGGLLRYGIFRARGRTIRQYGRMVAGGIPVPDVEDEIVDRVATFWIDLPDPPANFFNFAQTDFALTTDEADWLAERFLSTETQLTGPNLLGTFVRALRADNRDVDADYVWQTKLPVGTDPHIRDLCFQARQFSYLARGAALLYNLLLVEAVDDTVSDPREWPRDYREEVASWADECTNLEVPQWCESTDPLFAALGGHSSIPDGTRRFVSSWARLVHEIGPGAVADSDSARTLVRQRELDHKRGHARFRNHKRLLAYPGYAGTGQMNYRWPLVRQVLDDLRVGIHNGTGLDADT